MRGDILVKIFAGVLFAAGAVMAALIWVLWDTFLGPFVREFPIFAVLGLFVFAILCLPQIIGGVLAWRFGSVVRVMALEPEARTRDHAVLRILMGIDGLILLGIVGLSGITLVLDWGFSGLCGLVLLVLAAVGPQKVAGVA